MRLIDADALKNTVRKCPKDYPFTKQAMDAWREFITLIDDAPTVGGWISVKDRLPDNDYDVLVCAMGFLIKVGVYIASSKEWWVYGANSAYIVTHWMPLPEPPKEEHDAPTD